MRSTTQTNPYPRKKVVERGALCGHPCKDWAPYNWLLDMPPHPPTSPFNSPPSHPPLCCRWWAGVPNEISLITMTLIPAANSGSAVFM
jgi:hypothetical protein